MSRQTWGEAQVPKGSLSTPAIFILGKQGLCPKPPPTNAGALKGVGVGGRQEVQRREATASGLGKSLAGLGEYSLDSAVLTGESEDLSSTPESMLK